MMFQNYALFPHLTVRQNVMFGARDDVAPLLERFGLARLADARPGSLSGGEQQRVALARALARQAAAAAPRRAARGPRRTHPRHRARRAARGARATSGLPALVVTHDFEDAASLADLVGVVVDGRLRQLASPAALVARPADAFVGSLTGANLLPGRARRAGDAGLTALQLDGGGVVYSTDARRGSGRGRRLPMGRDARPRGPRRLGPEPPRTPRWEASRGSATASAWPSAR